MIASYLIDKSAYTRIRIPAVREVVEPLLLDDRVAVCPMVTLELLYSAKSTEDYDRLSALLGELPSATMNAATWSVALDLQRRLSRRGQHRIAIPDLLIAAAAIQYDLVVLHYDKDFDLIAAVSDLQHQWVVDKGSVS
ncbi:MAG: PIN domain nuclease [Pseudonocardia sp.]|nr:PIN domain nuclease [Pseudonocardia sp.]